MSKAKSANKNGQPSGIPRDLSEKRPAEKQVTMPAKRIFLVDDHPMMRMGMAQLIAGETGLGVCGQAGSANEALAQLPKCQADLVITDLTLPGKGGLELIKDLRVFYPELPILVISMHDEMLHAERALRAGARGYLMKEAGGEKMIVAIRQVLAGQIFVSERMSAKILEIFSGNRTSTAKSGVESLSDREFEVFQLLGEGKSTKEVARILNLSSKTVDVHRGHIKDKLELKDATALVSHAVRWVASQNGGNNR
jgi:DNA-binding NarL/FixJ family response regulator